MGIREVESEVLASAAAGINGYICLDAAIDDVATVIDSVMRDDSPTYKIDALFERLDAAAKQIREAVAYGRQAKDLLKSCEDAKQNIRPAPGKICPDGLAILQADESTDGQLINKIVNTAKAAGFDNLLFAVKNK